MHAVNYTFGALWGGWLLFWLASARQFPDAYLQYRRRVKAIIPFLY